MRRRKNKVNMDLSAIAEPFLLGLSSGLFCVTTCLPFIGPVMGFEENTPARSSRRLFFQFMLGRFFGYILFGAAFGCLGQMIDERLTGRLGAFCLAILSVLLILCSAGVLKEKNGRCPYFIRPPLLMGFLTGVNVCPPFLMAVSAIVTLRSVWGGMLFFCIFFVGTTVYFLPMLFLGRLAGIRQVRILSRMAGLAAGCYFLFYAGERLLKT